MGETTSLLVRFLGDATGLRATFAQIDSLSAKSKANLEQLSMVSMGIGVAAIGAGAWGVTAAQEVEVFHAKLKVAMKDTQKAVEMFEWAKRFAQETPFEMRNVVDSAVRLENYGLSAKKWLPLIGDMAGAMGRDVVQGVEAVADAVSGGGMERLKEFGINARMLLEAGAHPGPGGGVAAQSKEDAEALMQALEKIMTTRFKGGMKELMGTTTGALSNFKDAIFNLRVAIGEALVPVLKQVTPHLQNIANKLTELASSPAGQWFIKVAGSVGLLVGALGGTSFAILKMHGYLNMVKEAWALVTTMVRTNTLAVAEDAAVTEAAAVKSQTALGAVRATGLLSISMLTLAAAAAISTINMVKAMSQGEEGARQAILKGEKTPEEIIKETEGASKWDKGAQAARNYAERVKRAQERRAREREMLSAKQFEHYDKSLRYKVSSARGWEEAPRYGQSLEAERKEFLGEVEKELGRPGTIDDLPDRLLNAHERAARQKKQELQLVSQRGALDRTTTATKPKRGAKTAKGAGTKQPSAKAVDEEMQTLLEMGYGDQLSPDDLTQAAVYNAQHRNRTKGGAKDMGGGTARLEIDLSPETIAALLGTPNVRMAVERHMDLAFQEALAGRGVLVGGAP
ncbi:MAG TPA: hypothetical protein PKI27_03575 [Dermatophilaceae bacterium]|nr:hypothetical protein [Dermatophilaceae bacterium]